MNMELGLYQEQTQKLVMTQQMRQAIQLLQCTSEELNDYLLSELNKNPLIDYQPAPALSETSWTIRRAKERGARRTSTRSQQGNPLEQLVRAEKTIADALEEQLHLLSVPEGDVVAAEKLLGCINENGYLECTDTEGERLCGSAENYQAGLRVLQQCDPPGIGARSLQECLLLQVKKLKHIGVDGEETLAGRETMLPSGEETLENEDKTLADENGILVAQIISYHLEDVATGRLQIIAKALGVTVQAIQKAVDCIRNLNPRPGLNLGSAPAQYVVPEVLVKEIDGRYEVFINDDVQPAIQINRDYLRMLRNRDRTTKRFLQQHLQSAQWLTRSLEQRKVTLFRVAQAIVDVQQQFFEDGPVGLRPLTLHQVAEQVELHESTVSRTVRGKYMQTPRGVFELKYFFTAELQSEVGAVSAESVKYLIRQLVDAEDSQHPLSDEALCKKMSGKGIRVSRRTVAKYRDELHIPSSARRRRFV